MVRQALRWSPEWDASTEGMVVNMINANLWRFAPLYDFEDIYQECFMLFAMCCERYPHVVEAAHFTALLKRCIINHFHYLASTRRGQVSNRVATVDDEQVDFMNMIPAREETGERELAQRLKESPDPVRMLLEGLERKGRPRQFKHERAQGTRETTNQFLCRIAGCDPSEVNLRQMVEAAINGD